MTFDLDVILAAHGAGDGSPANALVHERARRLESTLVGARVRVAFRRGDPGFAAALRLADRPDRLVVPLLTSEGHYASLLHDEAARVARPGMRPTVAPAIGTHPALVASLVQRVRATVAGLDVVRGEASVIVVGHGTARHAESGTATRAVAAGMASVAGVRAHAAFLDESPTIEETLEGIGPCAVLVVVPFLFGGGDHATADVPARVAACAALHGMPGDRIAFIEPLGGLPVVDDIIERTVRASRGHRVQLTAGARASQLSRRQVEIVASRLASLGVDLSFVAIETRGDRDRSTPMDAFGTDDPFTAEISEALRSGRIDIAIHSMKDLPFVNEPGVVDAAILPRAAAHEVLVSRDGVPLSALPAGARVGTSCARRASQVRRARPDLVPVPVRGDVPARIAAVDRGDADAVILAAAGLERLDLQGRIAESFALDQFVPAPAQGAIAVQCRTDSPHRALLRRLDDRATRLAVRAERAFAREVTLRDRRVPAAYATVAGDEITLRARVIDDVSLAVSDTTLRGRAAERLGIAAATWLLAADAGRVRREASR
jgi:hydroxymethylbilane synthase